MVKVSVIIPVYNVEDYLEKSLNSVINQTLKDIEIICVNDGSSDNSLNILNEFSNRDSRVIVANQDNQGAGIARNAGLKIAKGEYVYFFDADDYIRKHALEKAYNNAISNNSDIVIFKSAKFNDSRSYLKNFIFDLDDEFGYVDYDNFTFTHKDIKKHVFDNSFAPWFKLYKKEFVDENDFKFQGVSSYNDVLFHVKTILKASSISYVPDYLFVYRLDNSNSVTNDNSKHFNIFEVVDSVRDFLDDEGFMQEYKKQYNAFELHMFIRHLVFPISEKYFKEVKTRFLNADYSGNELIEESDLIMYNQVINTSIDDIDNIQLQLRLDELRDEYDSLFESNEEIKLKNEKLEKEYAIQEEVYSNVVNSNSLKITKSLRNTRLSIHDYLVKKMLKRFREFKFYKNKSSKLENENEDLKVQLEAYEKKLKYNQKLLNESNRFILLNSDLSKKDDPNSRKRILFVSNGDDTDTQNLASTLSKTNFHKYDCYLLNSYDGYMILYIFNGRKFMEIQKLDVECKWAIDEFYVKEFNRVYLNVLIKYSFDSVLLFDLFYHTFDIANICNKLKIPLILFLKDYYLLCPANKLLDKDYAFDNCVCSNSQHGICCDVLNSHVGDFEDTNNFVHEWRNEVSVMFRFIDKFLSSSNDIKDNFQNIFVFDDDKIKLVEDISNFDFDALN